MCTEGEDKEAYLKEAVECLEKLEQELIKAKSKFSGGESIGYLDIAIGWISYWLPVWEEVGSMTIVDPTRFPATAGWAENFRNHPVVKDKLPPRDKMIAVRKIAKRDSKSFLANWLLLFIRANHTLPQIHLSLSLSHMESKEAVKLLGFWPSPFSIRVEWALRLKGVEYEYIEEDIFNKSPMLLELNPIGKKVPVLIHGEKVILESLVILEYIDETWKQFPILPRDPYDRAMARFWAKFAEEKLLENTWMAMCTQGEEKETCRKQAVESLEKIEQELIKGKSKFFGGESIGYLDIALGLISYWLPVWEEVGSMTIADPTRFPATACWTENFCSHPAVKDKLPPRDKMVVYFQWRSKEIGAQIASARKG
ncbi:hypothetical protein RHSIM_Rhsim04G0181100 [Rhododendron simsii]|uniref:Probable glutathione S-transferase n=1 Tax=Rhododendron simsii TaxID=118357 RepID=A0A834LTU7_RHOSS|nr:hypothetical protein RHSIM_Rhsim04G0181100 [Rhododendron simsii]